MDPTVGTIRDEPTEEEAISRTAQGSSRTKRVMKADGTKMVEPKRNIKKKPAAIAPIHRMVQPYTPQQFFNQKADITNGQLLASSG
jgi:hypothetical protein